MTRIGQHIKDMTAKDRAVIQHDDMGRVSESLLAWMRDVATARDDFQGKHRTVNLKFSTATLRMWVQRVDDAIGSPNSPTPYEAVRVALRWALEQMNDGNNAEPPDHDCELISNPERGECRFHKRWVQAMQAAGLDFADDDHPLSDFATVYCEYCPQHTVRKDLRAAGWHHCETCGADLCIRHANSHTCLHGESVTRTPLKQDARHLPDMPAISKPSSTLRDKDRSGIGPTTPTAEMMAEIKDHFQKIEDRTKKPLR